MSNAKSRELQTLEEIRDSLNTYLSLYKAIHSKEIQAMKADLLKVEIRKKIYDLCDGSRTVKEIAQAVDPSKLITTVQPLVSYHLSILEGNGLVLHRDDKGQRYYIRALE